MKKEKFCSDRDWSVLIPYSDLQKMVDSLKSAEELQREYEWTKKELAAVRGLISETWEKLGELEKMI